MIDEIRDYGRKNKKETGYDKVYFTASQWKTNSYGEDKLEKYFSNKDFKVIAPEKYTFSEQLNILLNCKCFASTIGSCSHNSIFLENDASVILIPRANYLTGYQMTVNTLWNQSITIVDCHLSVFVNKDFPWEGPFFYYVSQNLKDYFEDRSINNRLYWRENFKDYKYYIKDNQKRIKNVVSDYTGSLAFYCMTKYKESSFFKAAGRRLCRTVNKLFSSMKRIARKFLKFIN